MVDSHRARVFRPGLANAGWWPGGNRFLVRSEQVFPLDQQLCLDGTLTTGGGASTLEVSKFERHALVP
jgi:hypothetical protein